MKILTEYQEKVIEEALIMDVDGFWYFQPKENRGHFSAWFLRAIADRLDKRNAEWEKQLNDYFNSA